MLEALQEVGVLLGIQLSPPSQIVTSFNPAVALSRNIHRPQQHEVESKGEEEEVESKGEEEEVESKGKQYRLESKGKQAMAESKGKQAVAESRRTLGALTWLCDTFLRKSPVSYSKCICSMANLFDTYGDCLRLYLYSYSSMHV